MCGSRKLMIWYFLAGVVNVLLTTPMWVVNTRLKLQGVRFRNEDLQQTGYRGIFGMCEICIHIIVQHKTSFVTTLLYITAVHVLSLVDAFSQIIANEGVGTLWNGTLPSLILVLNPAVQFMFYEAMKRKAGKGGKKVSEHKMYKILHRSLDTDIDQYHTFKCFHVV